MSTHNRTSPSFLGTMTSGETNGVGPSTFSIIPCCSKGPFTLCNVYKTRNINVCQCLQMHSMTNLAVVNISYLKFSSNARGIMDSGSRMRCCCYSYRGYLQEEEKKGKKQCRQKRSDCIKDWLTKRNELGFERTLLREFRSENENEYRKFLRMTAENFDELLDLIKIDIQGDDVTSQRLTSSLRALINSSTNSMRWFFPAMFSSTSRLCHWRHGKGLGLTGMPKEQKKKLKESWTSPTFLHSRCKLDPSMFLPSNYAFTLAINIIIFLVLYKLHSVNGP